MTLQQLLAIVVSVALINPLPAGAASADINSSLGSITANGSVRVGEVQVPRTGTLFSGDQVRTSLGNAVVQYKDGPRVVLGVESAAKFSSSAIQLQSGQMAFETSGKPVLFAASTLRLEPAAEKSVANVTVQDKLASISVSEGSVRVMDPSGKLLASLEKGDARLFERVAPPPPPPAAAAAAPQMGSSSGAWLVALAAGVVGTTLGIAALVRANNAEDAADTAQAQAAEAKMQASAFASQIAAAQSANAALQTQVTGLNTQIAALNTFMAEQKTANISLGQLVAAQNQVNLIQAQLEEVQTQIDTLQTELIAGGSGASQGAEAQAATPTPEQLSALLDLLRRQRDLVLSLRTATNTVNSITNTVVNNLSETAK
ncbi:MAG: hypothetical protein HY648_04905 [Acidobacteria bacterium]|nr:hypothetical protein [Acidobacteriota bacterium]